jgi:quercetin dioxygenase-like cupin family protein
MDDRTIHNPVTGEVCTFIATSRETEGARTIAEIEVTPGGGVPTHRHGDHEERIEVLEGEIEVTLGGVARRCGAGEHVVIEPGAVHSWRNPSRDRNMRFRARMTPGNPGFELFLRVLFGLARDGEVRKSGIPRRLGDLGLLTEWDPSVLAGPLRLLAPLLRWSARRARKSGRADELLRRFASEHATTVEAAR